MEMYWVRKWLLHLIRDPDDYMDCCALTALQKRWSSDQRKTQALGNCLPSLSTLLKPWATLKENLILHSHMADCRKSGLGSHYKTMLQRRRNAHPCQVSCVKVKYLTGKEWYTQTFE